MSLVKGDLFGTRDPEALSPFKCGNEIGGRQEAVGGAGNPRPMRSTAQLPAFQIDPVQVGYLEPAPCRWPNI
jgi:hypothetical protein